MKATKRAGGAAYRLGVGAGRTWRGFARREQRFVAWLVARGCPGTLARAFPWVVKLVVLGVLLYAAFWLALLLAFTVAVAFFAGHATGSEECDFLGREAEKRDHRESLTYHPYNYDDDPDSRFEDD